MRFFFAILLLFASFPALTQSTEAGLKARLLHKPLYLRKAWVSDKLHVDSTGNLIGPSLLTTFTLAGFDIDSLKLKPNSLELSGHRAGLEFSKQQPRRVVLQQQDPFGSGTHSEELKLTLDAPPSGDYGPALDAILAPTLEDLIPSLPLEWQAFAATHLLHQPPTAAALGHSPSARRVGGGITAPTLQNHVEPEFTEAARALRWSGNVLVYFQVDRDGTPSHIRLLNPLGLGLDEQALFAVRKYRFTPAQENGQPVPVELNVEVNFAIY